MKSDLMMQAAMTTLRCIAVVVSHRSLLKSLAAYVLLFVAIVMLQPVSARAGDSSNINKYPEQIMSRLKERLKLTEDQETLIQPIIVDSFKKRSEILKNSGQDGKSLKSALQELQWSTDMQLGKILTEEQRIEYQKLREEQSEGMQRNDMRRGRGTRAGGLGGY